MANQEYIELLRDPRWQKKRLEILERDGWKCRNCGDEKTTLEIHHLRYQFGRKPWEYPPSTLATLCTPCHEYITTCRRAAVKALDVLRTGEQYMKAAGYMHAMAREMFGGAEPFVSDDYAAGAADARAEKAGKPE